MAKKAELKAVLSLNNVAFVRTMKQSVGMAKDLAKQFAKAPIQSTFVAGILSARKAVSATASSISMIGSIASTAFKISAVGAGALAAGVAVIGKESVAAASQLEQFTTAFDVLLGGVGKGSARMKELLGFANDKGLRLTEVAEASRRLEVLTGGLMSTGKGLEMVGNVAYGIQVPLSEAADMVGKLFSGLRTGAPIADSLERLREHGVISAPQKGRIEGMSKIDNAEAWKIAEQALQRYNGRLTANAQTWQGMMTRFHDSIEEAMRQFGTPLMESLKPALSSLTTTIFANAGMAAVLGKKLGDGISAAVEILRQGFADPSSLVEPFKTKMGEAMDWVGKKTAQAMGNVDFLKIWDDGVISFTEGLSAKLQQAFATPVGMLDKAIERAMTAMDHVGKSVPSIMHDTGVSLLHPADFYHRYAEGPTKAVASLPGKGLDYLKSLSNPFKALEAASFVSRIGDKITGAATSAYAAKYNPPEYTPREKPPVGSERRFAPPSAPIQIGQGILSDTWARANDKIKSAEARATPRPSATAQLPISDAWHDQFKRRSALPNIPGAAGAGMMALNPLLGAAMVNASMPALGRGGALGSTGGLRTGGLSSVGLGAYDAAHVIQGGLSGGAYNKTDLIRGGERRRNDLAARAERMARYGGVDPLNPSLHMRGDFRRMQNFQREQERGKQGLDRTNELMQVLIDHFDTAWSK